MDVPLTAKGEDTAGIFRIELPNDKTEILPPEWLPTTP